MAEKRTDPTPTLSPRRLILAGLGLLCVGLALLGIVVPGLPTTIFLIFASYLFTRSCPILEQRLLGIRAFRPYLKYVRGDEPMPLRARVAAIALMWIAVSTSLALLATRRLLEPWTAALVVGAAVAGSVMILSWRRLPGAATGSEIDRNG